LNASAVRAKRRNAFPPPAKRWGGSPANEVSGGVGGGAQAKTALRRFRNLL
jgi:hypothetical protein